MADFRHSLDELEDRQTGPLMLTCELHELPWRWLLALSPTTVYLDFPDDHGKLSFPAHLLVTWLEH